MIGRRLMMLGSLAATSGCATRSLEECDPHTGGVFDYFACRRQYDERSQMARERLAEAEKNYRAELDDRQRLEEEENAIERDLAETRTRVTALQEKREKLEHELESLTNDQAHIKAFVDQLTQYLLQLDQVNTNVIAYQPPVIHTGPAQEYIVKKLPEIKARAESQKIKTENTLNELAYIWGEFLLNHITFEILKKILFKMVRDIGLDAINPALGLAFTLNDIREIIELIKKHQELLENREKSKS